MKLKKIIDNLDGIVKIEGNTSLEIRGISYDSKMIKEGYLFVALKGARFNGLDFIDEAIDRGGYAVLLEGDGNEFLKKRKEIGFIYVRNARTSLSAICKLFYGDIHNRMNLIGVTGTNGKTTITYLIESLFKARNEEAAVIGTVNYRFGKRLIPAVNTTPGILDIYSLLSNMEKERIKNCVIEVSSHSLDQGRVDNLFFDIAIFTNLTAEHLDYHKNLEDYLNAKIKLFTKIKENGFAVINIDDANAEKIIQRVKSEKKANIITYGIEKESDVCAKDIRSSFDGLKFCVVCHISGNSIEIESSLIGRHNVYNILASISAGIAMGMSLEEIKNGIGLVRSLPGRLENIDTDSGFSVYVDYAHTENGLENVLKALRELRPERIISVFGCGGDRDRSKRPIMGRVSTELSDKVFITSDNPRSEEPMDIINEIIKGIDAKKDNYVIEPDRFNAIKKALEDAQKGDIVLLAGKGHETYQIFKNFTQPFDDREVVRRILKGMRRHQHEITNYQDTITKQ